jgi:enterochelin esterase-like enzyme
MVPEIIGRCANSNRGILMHGRTLIAVLAGVGASLHSISAKSEISYLDNHDFRRSSGPKGTLRSFRLDTSAMFTGYRHWWAVYTPAQELTWRRPALMVFQDGTLFARLDGPWRTPIVLDNLIARRQIPPMVAVFVGAGADPDPAHPTAYKSNRSVEYDMLGPKYCDFLLREILPLAQSYAIWSEDPNDHGIGGHSSGAICAFTAAWNRPDQFRKVYSANGSFTHIRGGDAYPAIIREQPKRPLRIYQWSDTHDLSTPAWGDWVSANRLMTDALDAAGYDHQFDFGEGTHDPRYAAAHFPKALRWLWCD